MTFLELRQLVLSYTDDAAGGYFTPDQVNVFLNNGLRELQKKLILAYENWYVKCVQATLTVEQNCYYLPEDFLQMNRFDVILTGSTPSTENRTTLFPITMQEARVINFGPAQPQAYFLKKDKFNIIPAPDTAYVIEMLYSYRVPQMVNDNDVPDCPEEWAEFIAISATLDCFVKDREAAPGALIKKKEYYDKLLENMATDRTVDAPRTVVMTESGSGTGIYF